MSKDRKDKVEQTRSRKRKWLRHVSLGALAVVVLAVVVAALLLNTGWGARLVLSQTDRFAPGELRFDEVEGTLSGPLEIRRATYDHRGLSVRADRIRLDVSIGELLTSHLLVEELRVRGLRVTLPRGDGHEAPREPWRPPALDLPMRVTVERAGFDDLEVLGADGAELVALDRLELGGALLAGRLELTTLELEAPWGAAELRGRVDTRAGYRGDIDARLQWQRGERSLAGRAELNGDLDGLSLNLALEPPLDAALSARITGLLAEPSAEFELSLDSLQPGALGLGGVPGPLAGSLSGEADPRSLRLDGWIAAAGERVAIEAFSLTRADRALRLERLELRGREGARMSAAGTVSLQEGDPVVDVRAQWSDVAVPLTGDRLLASPEGNVLFRGVPDDYRFEAGFRVSGAVPDGEWRASGGGDLDGVVLEEFVADTLEGRLTGDGVVAWRPDPRWNLSLSATGIDPGSLAPRWPGAVSFRASTEGGLRGDAVEGRVAFRELAGALRGRPVSGSGEVSFTGMDRLEGDVVLRSGDSVARARGRYGETTEASVRLDAASLGDWYPGARGSLSGSFELWGPRRELRLTGDFHGESLKLAEYSAASIEGGADVRLGESPSGRVFVVAGSPAGPGMELERGRLELAGAAGDHRLELEAAGPGGSLAATATGALGDDAWRGSLRSLSVTGERVGRWELQDPTSLAVSGVELELGRLCLASETGNLCARGRWSRAEGARASATLSAVPLQGATPLLRHALRRPADLSGTVDAELELHSAPDLAPVLHMTFSGRGATLRIPGAGGVTELELTPLEGALHLERGVMEGRAEVGLGSAGRAESRIRSQEFEPSEWVRAPVAGNVEVSLRDLEPLEPLMAPLSAPEGSVRGDLSLGGRLGALELDGELTMEGFGIEVPNAGIALRDGRLSVSGDGRGFRYSGRVESGEGRLELEGTMAFGGEDRISADARVTGENFLAVDRPGIEAVVTPDLALKLRGDRLDVTGGATVPRAVVDAGELEGGGVSTSPDVVVVGRSGEERDQPLRVFAEVDVTLGEDITVRAPGFEGAVSGRLHVSERPGRPTLGRGELSVSGSYEAYGQSLTIRRGRLLLSGTPVDNPNLDISAVRVVDEVTAGVRIEGTARTPRLTLFSEPPLGNESEILSYLILGRPLDSATSGDGQLLTGAATSLGLKGGDLLAKQIGARFGISDIGVDQSDELGQSALTLGKYLSPSLYLSYGVGLVEPVSVIRIRYELSDHWALEAASGRETSGAIKFYYER